MKNLRYTALAAGIVLLFAGVVAANDNVVKVYEKYGMSSYLTDSKGMALYWFKKDSPGNSACAGPCLEKWPVFYRVKVTPGGGLNTMDFGTIIRPDGKKQTTFRGYPLYYFFRDTAAGETNGNNINSVWFVVTPSDFPVK